MVGRPSRGGAPALQGEHRRRLWAFLRRASARTNAPIKKSFPPALDRFITRSGATAASWSLTTRKRATSRGARPRPRFPQRYASGDRRRAVTPAQARQFRNDYEGEIRPLTDLRLRVEGTLPYARDARRRRASSRDRRPRVGASRIAPWSMRPRVSLTGRSVLSDADIRALSSPSLAGVFADVEGFLDENGRLSDNQRRALADVVARNADKYRPAYPQSTYDNHAAFASEYDPAPSRPGFQPSFDRPGEEEAAGAIPTADQWRYDEGGQAIPYQDETTGRWYLPIRGRVQMVGPDHPAVLRFQRDDDERSNDRGPEIRGRGGAAARFGKGSDAYGLG